MDTLERVAPAAAATPGASHLSATGVGLVNVDAHTIVATLNVPAQGHPYVVVPSMHVWCQWSALHATTHQFALRLMEDGIGGAVIAEQTYGCVQNEPLILVPNRGVVVAGGGAKTIVATLRRVAGTNNVTTYADATLNRIAGLILPT